MVPNSTLFKKEKLEWTIESEKNRQSEQADEPKLSQSQARKCAYRIKGRAEHMSRVDQS